MTIPQSSNRTFWIGVAAFFGLACILWVGALTRYNQRQISAKSNANQAAAVTTSGNNATAASAELTPARRLAAAKETLKNPPSDYNFTVATNHLTAIPQTADEYKEAQRLLNGLPAAKAQFLRKKAAEDAELKRKQAPIIREALKGEYENFVSGINPNLNYIGSKVSSTKGGYALWATHEYFSQFTFSIGSDGPQISAWIDRNRARLNEAGIVRVGVMGRGGYASSCWFDLK
jgi:hypothetical protein